MFGCPGLQFAERDTPYGPLRRRVMRFVMGFGMVVGVPVAVAVGSQLLFIAGPIAAIILFKKV
jgi:hypothetical protein